MKKTTLKFAFTCAGILIIGTLSAQNKNLGIGTTTPNPNAVLDVVSPTNNQGVLLPRLTTSQRTTLATALDADDNGLMLYDTDLKSIFVWNGTTWKMNDASVLQLPLSAFTTSGGVSFHIGEMNAANDTTVVAISNAGSRPAIRAENTNTNGALKTAHGIKGVAIADGNNAGVYGTTKGSGTGVMAETWTGWSSVFGYQHNPTFGWAADFEIDAPSNSWASVFAHTHGTGPAGAFITYGGNDSTALYAKTTGTGLAGYFERDNASGSQPAVYAKSNGGFTGNSAAIIAESNGGYAGLISKQKSGAGNALVAISESPEAGSWGLMAESANGAAGVFQSSADSEPAVQVTTDGDGGGMSLNNNGAGPGFTITNGTTSNGIGLTIFQNGTARAAQFQVNNTTSTNAAVRGAHLGLGNAGFFSINNPSSNAASLQVNTNGFGPAIITTYTGGSTGGAAIFAENTSATNGFAGNFHSSNASNTFPAIQASTTGTGPGMRVFQDPTSQGGGMDVFLQNTSGTAPGFAADVQGSGNGVMAIARGTGRAGFFQIDNATNGMAALEATTNGTSPAFAANTGSGWTAAQVTQNGNGSALHVENLGAGLAGYFNITNSSNPSQALSVQTNGTGGAMYISSNNAGASFPIVAIDNNGGGNSFEARTSGTGNALYVNHTGASGNLAVFYSNTTPMARIDKTGKGYFNNGTVNSGADVAEMFSVEGSKDSYEPGDVLVISESTDRTVEKSSTASSTRVAGVYATKPGVRLTEENIDTNIDELVPMGVVGVIPTKVCLENGPIKRGDLLVTSSKTGHAMKAIPVNINGVLIYPTGAILGKALENFDGQESGLIKVLVNVK